MLPTSRSIFHIEELACSSTTTTRSEASTNSFKRTSSDDRNLVGLQLLIAQCCRSSEQQASVHLVTKHSINSLRSAPSQFSFLRTCHLCNKELRPNMDIYVYRGEQGFCSDECREHQMLVEERREFEIEALVRRKQLQKLPHVHDKAKNTIRKWNDKNMIQTVA